MTWLDKATKAIEDLLLHREVLAIVLGFAISLGVTQAIKTYVLDAMTRNRANVLAIVLGAVSTYLIFPEEHGWRLRAVFAFAVGLLAPIAYKSIVWLLERKAPGLAEKVSGDL